MKLHVLLAIASLALLSVAAAAVPEAVWVTLTGKRVRIVLRDAALAEGEVLGANETDVVLKRQDGELVVFPKNAAEKVTVLSSEAKQADVFFCDYANGAIKGGLGLEQEYSESADAREMVTEISKAAGLRPLFTVRPGPVSNAAAFIRGYDRYVLFNPQWVSQLKAAGKTNWSIYSVMAHEVGHHLNGHTIVDGGSRRDFEIEADEFSGFILAKLGASLEEAQVAIKTFGSDTGSETHPGRSERLKAIERGWREGKKRFKEKGSLTSEEIAKAIDMEAHRARQSSQPVPTMLTESAPMLPAQLQRAPAGTIVIPCGCWGPVMFGAVRVSAVCASGREAAMGCPNLGMCFGGGFPYASVCQ